MPKKSQSKRTKASGEEQDVLRESEPIEPHEIASGMTTDQMEKFLDKLMQLSKKQESSPPSSGLSEMEELWQKQFDMVAEWEERTGLESSAASMILGLYKEPMTKARFLFEEGYEMAPSMMEDCPELLAELPEWYEQLPDELPE